MLGAFLTAMAVVRLLRTDHWGWGHTVAVLVVALGAALLAAFRTDDFWDDLAPWMDWGFGGDTDARTRRLNWLLLAVTVIGVAGLFLAVHLGWIGKSR